VAAEDRQSTDFPAKRIARCRVPVLVDGRRVWRDMEEVDSSSAGAHTNWPERFFARLVDGYLARSGNRGGPVGNAWSYLFPAAQLLEFARPIMERLAADHPPESLE